MSITADGQTIRCDGLDCKSTVRVPVGLRSVLTRERRVEAAQPAGWIFVVHGDRVMHYCPQCKASYLRSLIDEGRHSHGIAVRVKED